MKNQFKKNTIGYKADQLAKKYGNSITGLTVLQFALERATGARNLRFVIDTGPHTSIEVPMTQTPTFKKLSAETLPVS